MTKLEWNLDGRWTFCPPRISENSINIKINLDYFLTSLWRLKRFYEGLQGFHKTFWGTAKKCENKYLSLFSLFVRIRTGKINSIRHFVSKPSAFAHLIFFIQSFCGTCLFFYLLFGFSSFFILIAWSYEDHSFVYEFMPILYLFLGL